jgi:hypothetical protein
MTLTVPLHVTVSLRLFMRCPACTNTAELYTPDTSDPFYVLAINCGTCGHFSRVTLNDPNDEDSGKRGFINVKAIQ